MTRLTLFTTVSAFALGACAIEIERTFDDPAVAAATEDLARILGDRPVKVRLETDASLAPQEWRVKAADGTLTVSGLNGLGVAYGVYSFLERIGCRWYAPNVERTPDLAGWTLPQLDERGKPAIMSRDPYVSSDKPPGIWYLRNKGTTSVGVGGTERTGSPNHCHTFGMYAQAITGRCAKAGADWMCLTDPEVRHAVADEMKRFMVASHAPDALLTHPVTPGAPEAVRALRKSGHDVEIVTGRPAYAHGDTERWLERAGIGDFRVTYVDKYGRDGCYAHNAGDPPTVPLEELLSRRFDVVIDDSPQILARLSEWLDTRILVFSRPWNESFPLASNMTRVRGWDDILAELAR